MSNPSVLLDIRDLSVFFDTDEGRICAADRLSLSLDKGQILGLVGETGCGKSVTGRAIIRVLPKGPWVHLSGEVHFQGQELLRLDEKRMEQL